MSLFNKKLNTVSKTIKNGLSGFSSTYSYTDVFDSYFSAYLMSGFDKNVQAILFNLYRISDLIESCIDNIPEHIKSEIASEMIFKEAFNQNNFTDENEEIDVDKFEIADKDWDAEHEKLHYALINWGSSFNNINTQMYDKSQFLIDLKKNMMSEAIENNKSAVDWKDLDTNSQNFINLFYRVQPTLLKFCKLNILDILNGTNSVAEIDRDLEKLKDEKVVI